MENNNTFEYTYSSKHQEEIDRIRQKYLPEEENKMETLRKLDASVETSATVISLVLGIVGTLIMGGGMSMCMVFAGNFFIPGIILGVFGMAVVGLAYPVYKRVVRKKREKLAPKILALIEELSKSE